MAAGVAGNRDGTGSRRSPCSSRAGSCAEHSRCGARRGAFRASRRRRRCVCWNCSSGRRDRRVFRDAKFKTLPPPPVAVVTPAPAPTQAPIVPAGFDASAQKLADREASCREACRREACRRESRIGASRRGKGRAEWEAADKAAKARAIADKTAKAKERPAAPEVEEKERRRKPSPNRNPRRLSSPSRTSPFSSPPAGDVPAFSYFLGFAHRGNGEAMLKVAESYESGRGVAQNGVWACGWYELAGRRGVSGARRARKRSRQVQPRELRQCQDWADGQAAPSG